MRTILLALALSGCASAAPGLGTALADGQLACAVRSAVVAVQAVTPAGAVSPVLARGASSAAVQAVCAALQGVAVAPPANGVAGSVTVALPSSITIPLGVGSGSVYPALLSNSSIMGHFSRIAIAVLTPPKGVRRTLAGSMRAAPIQRMSAPATPSGPTLRFGWDRAGFKLTHYLGV